MGNAFIRGVAPKFKLRVYYGYFGDMVHRIGCICILIVIIKIIKMIRI